MKQARLSNICRDILVRWKEKRKVDEELVYIFLDGILDMISDPEPETIPDYKKATAKLQEMWQYKDFGEMSAEEIFLCGGLWAGAKISEMKIRRERQQKTIEELACVYESKQWFFKAISDHPGIRHKDLAERGNQSTSQLSQFVAKAAKEELITFNRVGREKYYYLGKKGEQVYEKIQRKKSSQHFVEFMSLYGFTSFNKDMESQSVLSSHNNASDWMCSASSRIRPAFKPKIVYPQSMFENQEIVTTMYNTEWSTVSLKIGGVNNYAGY